MSNIFFVILILCIMVYVFIDIKKGRLTVKESFWWSLLSLIMLVLAIFPKTIDVLAGWLGIAYGPSLLLMLCSIFLLLMNYKSSKKIGNLNQKITDLEQEIALEQKKDGHKK